MQIKNIARELNCADSEGNPTYPLFTKFVLKNSLSVELIAASSSCGNGLG